MSRLEFSIYICRLASYGSAGVSKSGIPWVDREDALLLSDANFLKLPGAVATPTLATRTKPGENLLATRQRMYTLVRQGGHDAAETLEFLKAGAQPGPE